jgi:2-iminobutanoate/2-iminopropanoate deaminase
MDVDGNNQIVQGDTSVNREIIRVEPFDSNFEKWGVPVSVCTRAGDMIFVSGLPPFDPKTGELLVHAPFEQQAERCLEELKTALDAAGSDLEHVMKVNVICVSPERFKAFNEIYKRYFPKNPPARIFFCVPVWTGPFDIEIECIAVRKG